MQRRFITGWFGTRSSASAFHKALPGGSRRTGSSQSVVGVSRVDGRYEGRGERESDRVVGTGLADELPGDPKVAIGSQVVYFAHYGVGKRH